MPIGEDFPRGMRPDAEDDDSCLSKIILLYLK